MKLHTLLASSLITISLSLGSPARAADTPSVDSILAKAVDALGGKAAMEKVHSRIIKIRIESDTIPSSTGEIYTKAPNKQASRIDLSGTGVLEDGFDGKVAWAKSPWEPLRVKEGEELAKVKRDAELHRELKMKTLYPGLTVKGKEKIGEEEAYLLESKLSGSSREQFWFSAKTGLLVRQQSDFEAPQGKVSVTVNVQEHATFEGLKYPSQMKMRYSMGDQSFEFNMKAVEVKHNVTIDDAKFAKPSA